MKRPYIIINCAMSADGKLALPSRKQIKISNKEDIKRMCFYYTPLELCFCLRAWLHEYMFQKTNFKKWIYLDSDILVYSSLEMISDLLDDISIYYHLI